MATFTKLKLSGSTDGKAIKVVQTATAGTTIHTAHATALDEIWLYAHNSSSSPVKLTLEFGGVAAPDDHIEINIGSEGTGLVLVSPGLLLTNSLVVRAFAGTSNVVTLTGYVNRIA
jgi:hypothetical protein